MTIAKGTFQSHVKHGFQGPLCTLHFFGALPSLGKKGPGLHGPHISLRITLSAILIYRLVMDYLR